MKKYLLIAAIGLLTTAGVTATVLSSSKKKETKEMKKEVKKETKKDCNYKKKCSRFLTIVCF